jgi:hypothetical protein
MPIRFRCLYCDQFLGISRAKAGQVVDCPQCGRSIRVPPRDGRAEPASAPRLDLADPQLADAMAALAALQHPGATDAGAGADDADEADDSAVPVVIDVPPLSAPLVREVEVSHAPRNPVDLAESADPKAFAAEIARLARQADAAAPRTASSSARRVGGWRALLTPLALVTITAATLAGFAVGLAVAPRLGTTNRPATDRGTDRGAAGGDTTNTPDLAAAPIGTVGDAGNAASDPADAAAVVLQGRATYETAGTTRPDAEARVLALPETREGTLTLPALSLLQSPGGADWRIGEQGVRIAGGQVALAGADGEFELTLPAAGRYWLVILSQHQPRDPARDVEPAVLTLLGQYFDRPLLLVGKRAYHIQSVLATDEETPVIRHRFPEGG